MTAPKFGIGCWVMFKPAAHAAPFAPRYDEHIGAPLRVLDAYPLRHYEIANAVTGVHIGLVPEQLMVYFRDRSQQKRRYAR